MVSLQPLSNEQLLLERVADRLLETFPADSERPAYSEQRLAQRRNMLAVISIDSLSEELIAQPQEFCDELRFLMSVTRLSPEIRRCLRLWVEGWSQIEIAEGFNVSQQTVSLRIRIALRACYDSAPLSFRRFSNHTVYRRPTKRRESGILRTCTYCEHWYSLGIGAGRYCSPQCREKANHIAAQKTRRKY